MPLAALGGKGAELLELLSGEYNNHEQVWQQKLDGTASHERRHWRIERTGESSLALSVAPGQSAGEPAWIFDLLPGSLDTVVTAVGEREPFCVYGWVAEENGFTGRETPSSRCPAALPRYWRVSADRLLSSHGEPGLETPYSARRVRYYDGWIALQRRRIDPHADKDDHILIRGLRAHDGGFIVSITDGGDATGYALELARLTYQNTSTAVLKLGVIDESSGQTLSYAWSAPFAERIGLNLRWVQAGFTLED
ncbi:MAG: hypothetical protein OXU72_04185 [Gammaproteobacteria bacterium]|nr:hypothetical protein [Gammaproteobacteria bacterium]